MSFEGDEGGQSPPRQSPTRNRSITINTSDSPTLPHRAFSGEQHPRLSPSHTRSNNDITDPDARERQRTMDVDIAMQMSRMRRGSSSVPIPGRQQSHGSGQNVPIASSPEQGFRYFSPHEEHPLIEGSAIEDTEHELTGYERVHEDDTTGASDNNAFNINTHPLHDNDELIFNANDASNGLPMYQVAPYRSNFEFSHLEAFSIEEKRRLGIEPSQQKHPLSRNQDQKLPLYSSTSQGEGSTMTVDLAEPILERTGEAGIDRSTSLSPEFARLRQRKLSQSISPPVGRRGKSGKFALFEGNIGGALGAPPPSFVHPNGGQVTGPTTWVLGPQPGQGHDRPYRFSFYSNALPATIHARSLSELPAEGQTFEELFAGPRRPRTPERPNRNVRNFNLPSTPQRPSRTSTPTPAFGDNGPGLDRKSRLPDLSGEDDWEGNTWWLDILNPTDEEMRMLSKVFSIHPLTTEDIQMEEAREKIELLRNYYLPVNMYIIVFREGTLSFHFRPTPHPQNVRRRIAQLKDYINVTSDWISYALIDDITDAFGPLIQSIEYEVDSIDELVLILKEAEQSDMLRRIGTCRKKVMGLLRLMGNKADVVKGLAKRCNEHWSVAPKSDIGLYLSDIQDHLITMTQNLNHYEKILSRSHSNYLAQISIEMTDANNQINDVLSKLTALGTVLIPMNLVTGLWGMNVHVPGQDDEKTYTWFLCIIGGLVGFAVLGSILAYRLMMTRS